MRIVLDTNVLVSGLLWRGTPHSLVEHARNGVVTCVTSSILLAELDDVLARDKLAKILAQAGNSREHVLLQVRQLVDVIEPVALPSPVCRDPDDDHVIACAVAAGADAIVSGDRDLLELGEYAGIPILTASGALARMT